MRAMETLRARVQNGRLVLDVPTDLPEGTEVELVMMPASDTDPNMSSQTFHDAMDDATPIDGAPSGE
jgi:hypothetical protein